MLVFYGANQIGIPLVGVLAGVGVGGLAIALAAQDSLKNLLGSLMIFMDQPYKPGERTIVEGHDGFVETDSLNLLVSYWYHPPKRWKALAYDQQVNLEILRRFDSEGIRLAPPSSTTRLVQDSAPLSAPKGV